MGEYVLAVFGIAHTTFFDNVAAVFHFFAYVAEPTEAVFPGAGSLARPHVN